MRVFKDKEKKKLMKVTCNKCGRELRVENFILKEGCFHGEQKFGYFSDKDGSLHDFDLCENCYDTWIKSFTIPVGEQDITEFL